MTFARLLLLLLLMLSPLGLASAEKIAQPKAISSAQTAQKPSTAEQLAEEREARREAEHRKEVAETKAELVDFANGRLENWIGLYGLLIAAIAIIVGFFARNEARKAQQQAERAANIAGVEAAKAAKFEMLEFRQQAETILGKIRDNHVLSMKLTDGLQQKLNAVSVVRDNVSVELAGVAVTSAEEKELEELVAQITVRPKSDWSEWEYGLLLLDAASRKEWTRYVEIALGMAWTFEDSPAILANALFSIGFGQAELGNYAEAAQAYEAYLDRCHDIRDADRATVLSNWGNVLTDQARKMVEIDALEEADRLWSQASQRFDEAVALRPEKYTAFSNWGNSLIWQARVKTGAERDLLIARAESLCHKANQKAPGGGSYGLACIAGMRGEAAKAAEWLRNAKEEDVLFPGCKHIAADNDFDAIRETPEFQQALIDIGCKSEAQQTPLETPKPTPRKLRK